MSVRCRTILCALLALSATQAVRAAGDAIRRSKTIPVVGITSVDFAFDAPDTIPAGVVTLQLRNHGAMPHHAWLVRMEDGRTLRELEKALVQDAVLPSWASDVGGPGTVEPGGESRVTLRLNAGRHVIISDERVADGSTATMRGMYRLVEVRGPANSAAVQSDATIELHAADLRITGSVRAGRRRLHVRNRAARTQELRIYRLRAGGDEGALLEWLRTGTAAAPASAIGGVAGLAPGAAATIDALLSPGEYVLVHRAPGLRGPGPAPRWQSLRVQ